MWDWLKPRWEFPGPAVQPEAGLAYPGRSILSIASTNRICGLCEEVSNAWQLELERLKMLMQISVIDGYHVQTTSSRPYIDLSNELHVPAVKNTSNSDVTQRPISSTAIYLVIMNMDRLHVSMPNSYPLQAPIPVDLFGAL